MPASPTTEAGPAADRDGSASAAPQRRTRTHPRSATPLAGRIAVVTGAGSGIGRGSALALARSGATVYVADIDHDRAKQTAAEIDGAGGASVARAIDVTDAAAVQALADEVFAAHGRVDVLHNNAGVAHGGPTRDATVETWRRLVDINVMGVAHGIVAFLPRMLQQPGGGHIVNTASMLGLVGGAELVPYATTKHALVGLSESLHAEVSPQGVSVTALCPGMVNTRLYRDATLQGSMGAGRDRALRLHDRFGAKPEAIGGEVVRIVLRRRPRPVHIAPKLQVLPVWLLHRLSPTAAQPVARAFSRIMRGG